MNTDSTNPVQSGGAPERRRRPYHSGGFGRPNRPMRPHSPRPTGSERLESRPDAPPPPLRPDRAHLEASRPRPEGGMRPRFNNRPSGNRSGFSRPSGSFGNASRGNFSRTGGASRTGAPSGARNGRRGPRNSNRRIERPPIPAAAFEARPEDPALRKDVMVIPPPGENIRIIPLGGVEEIGRNMTLIEYKDDIIIIDAGFQFQDDDTPGIDYILPNTRYLEERQDKIRGMIITHGHLDHIGGLPYIMPRIGNPPIYTRNLTAIMVKKRQEEFPQTKPLNINVIEKDTKVMLGKLPVRFFGVTHTIPDSMGVIIDTPIGSVVNPGDFKLEHSEGVAVESEEKEYSVFEKEKTLFLMADSTNVENPGFSTPETLVHEGLEEIIKKVTGRLIIGTFASQLRRIIKIIEIAEKYGKKIVIEGRSMKVNIEIAILADMLKTQKGTIIQATDMDRYPTDKIIILSTGAQGEEFAALMRIATKNHKVIHITPRDTIVLSSSIIPGNEKSVEKLKDNIARAGARIVHYRTSEVYIHSTGHGNRGELEWLHKKIKPKFFMPVHGNHYRLRLHAELAESCGMPAKNIVVPDTGSIIEISPDGETVTKLKARAPWQAMTVDGFSIGDMQEVVLKDRLALAQDGMFVIVASINAATGKLKKSPDIISRGFIYLREAQDLLQQTRYIIKKTIEDEAVGMNPINFDALKERVTENITNFLFAQTAKRPIIIPVILGV
jgi:ribonuclease J